VLGGPYYGSVSLAASGLPPGVTASFTPTPSPAPACSRWPPANPLPPEPYNVTVTGTAGQQTATTVVRSDDMRAVLHALYMGAECPEHLSGGPSTSATIA